MSTRLPPDVQAQINVSVGAVLVSNNLSYLTLAIVLCGAWSYASRYRKTDPWHFKALVGVCVMLCIADAIATGWWAFDWAVTNYANPAVLAITPWQFRLDAGIVGITSLLVQCFYAWRIWMVSLKKNWYAPGLIIALAIMAFSVLMWMLHVVTVHQLIADIERVIPVIYLWLVGSVAADLIITMCMGYYLDVRYRMKRSTSHMSMKGRFQAIILRTVECNVLSLACQTCTVILFNRPGVGLYFALTDMTLAKIYTFSLLVSLNSRPINGASSSGGESSAQMPNSYVLNDRRVGTAAQQVSISVQRETTRDVSTENLGIHDDEYAMRKVKLDSMA